jgi:signal peptidase II
MEPVVGACALIVTIDQLTKLIVLRRAERVPAGSARLAPSHAINMHDGMLGASTRTAACLWIATAASAIAFLVAIPESQAVPAAIGVGLGIGGALSNLIDRINRGGVVDFIAIGPWPRFNLADAGLVAGLGLVGSVLL